MTHAKLIIINYLVMMVKFSSYNLFYETIRRRAK